MGRNFFMLNPGFLRASARLNQHRRASEQVQQAGKIEPVARKNALHRASP